MAANSHKTAVEFGTLATAVSLYDVVADLTGLVSYLGPDGAGATAPFDGITDTPNTMIPTAWNFALNAVDYEFVASYADLEDEDTAGAILRGIPGIEYYALALVAAVDAYNTEVAGAADAEEILRDAWTGAQDLPNQSPLT
jgi:hypothetical protein